MNLKNRKAVVVGLARTGTAVARFLSKRGAVVTGCDLKKDRVESASELEAVGISLELGEHRLETFINAELIVVSPGVPDNIEPLVAARSKGVSVIGEVELAAQFIDEPIIAVTGTNGKTTTTTMLGEMLKGSGLRVWVGGNIGDPLIGYVEKGDKADIVVVEISSFQLDTIEEFKPRVGTLLNITEDHLDRYPSFQAYVDSKLRLFLNHSEDDLAILNAADPVVKGLSRSIKSQKLFFNLDTLNRYGSRVHDSQLECCIPERGSFCFSLRGFKLRGVHNIENGSAAALAALASGGSADAIQDVLETFSGLPHRLEYVNTVDGVRYYNDSKGTNVAAVIKSLESFDEPIILIMGGRDKGGDYNLLKEHVKKRVKHLIVIGETKTKIIKSLGRCAPLASVADDMDEAVNMAHDCAVPGDVVLLSPACSSFDMFSDYTERGRAFCESVKRLSNQGSSSS
nr:UDP-N-acetylmuramoyl-L-alanine--D-glutamate ligase [Desulfobacterales bacterium]